jgi:hypothetical protein
MSFFLLLAGAWIWFALGRFEAREAEWLVFDFLLDRHGRITPGWFGVLGCCFLLTEIRRPEA